MSKHGIFTMNKKGIISAAVIVALGFGMAGGSVSADKTQALKAAERAAVAAEVEAKELMRAAAVFVPVVEMNGVEALDVGDSVPGVSAMKAADTFNQTVNAEIEKKKAEEEAKAKAEAEAKAKEEAEKKAAEERTRQEAARAEQEASSNQSSDSSSASSSDESADDAQDSASDSSASAGGSRDVSVLYKYAGYPYMYGGASPSGWDCSGFVKYVMANEFGVSVGRTSGEQAGAGYGISVSDRSQWQPGDLLIYRSGSGSIGHVGIYLGGGQMIHALNDKHDTLIQSVSTYEGWDSNTLVKVRRVLN